MRLRFSIRSLFIATALVLLLIQTQLATYALLKLGWIPKRRIVNKSLFFQGKEYYVVNPNMNDELPEGFQFVTTRDHRSLCSDGLWILKISTTGRGNALFDLDVNYPTQICFRDVTGDGRKELILSNFGKEMTPQWAWKECWNSLDYVDAYGNNLPTAIELSDEVNDRVRIIGFENQQTVELFSHNQVAGANIISKHTKRGSIRSTIVSDYRWADLFGNGLPVCCKVRKTQTKQVMGYSKILENETTELIGYFTLDAQVGHWALNPCEIQFKDSLDGLLAE